MTRSKYAGEVLIWHDCPNAFTVIRDYTPPRQQSRRRGNECYDCTSLAPKMYDQCLLASKDDWEGWSGDSPEHTHNIGAV